MQWKLEYSKFQKIATTKIGGFVCFIKSITALPNYLLDITFDNNIKKIYDVKPVFEKWPIFQILLSVDGLYEQVKIDAGGYGISWNDSLDLSCNELWENSTLL